MWEDPEIYLIHSGPGKAGWPKETQKKLPIKVIQTPRRAQLSEHAHVSIHTLYSFSLINTTCFTAVCLYLEIHFYTTDGPGPCHWFLVA